MSTGAQIHMRRHRPTASPEVAARAERLSYRLGEVGLGEVQIARDEGRLQPAEPAVAIFSKAVDSAIPVMIVAKPSARRRGGRCEAVEQHCAPIPPRGEDQATVG